MSIEYSSKETLNYHPYNSLRTKAHLGHEMSKKLAFLGQRKKIEKRILRKKFNYINL